MAQTPPKAKKKPLVSRILDAMRERREAKAPPPRPAAQDSTPKPKSSDDDLIEQELQRRQRFARPKK